MKTSFKLLLVAIVLLAALVGAWVAKLTLTPAAAPELLYGTQLSPPRPLGEFSLLAQDGQPFERARLDGRWTLMFFGFTHCPDVCPTTLAMLADVKRQLAAAGVTALPQVVLVSVDPERDTPPVMAEYVASFDPAFIGVTGTPAAIDRFTAELGIAHRKVVMSPEVYMVDHSAAILLFDPQGRQVAVFSPPHRAEQIAADFRRLLESG